MSNWQRRLACAALLLVAAGIVLGFGEAVMARYGTLPVVQYRHQVGAGEDRLTEAIEPTSYIYVRVVDAHTHLIKVATVLLLIVLLYPGIALDEKHKCALAATFVTGNVVFPAGVLAEIYARGWSTQALAAAGAMLILVAFAGMLWGLLRNNAT